MYKNNSMDKDDGEEVPSWLKDEKNIMGGNAEAAPLVPKKSLHTSTSYGGQSAGSANSSSANVEEDYGDEEQYHGEPEPEAFPAPLYEHPEQQETDTSWAAQEGGETANYGSTSGTNHNNDMQKWDEDEDSEDDDESSEEESDEEVPIVVKKKKKKKKRNKKGKKGRWHDSDYVAVASDTDGELNEEDDEVFLVKPRRNCCHSFFIAVQITAVLANLSMIAIEMVPIMIGTLEKLDIVLRCYFTFFSSFFLFTELELFDSSLNNWITRGFLYTFLGMVAKEQHIAMLANDTLITPKQYWNGVPWPSIFVEVASWCIIGIGCTYFVLGVFCLKALRDRFRRIFQGRMRAYKEGR